MNDILVPISPGELLDKITILRIKCARIADAAKQANVRMELSRLERSREGSLPVDADLAAEESALERVNAQLWDIDERAAIKRRINLKLDSALVEEKSYRPYR